MGAGCKAVAHQTLSPWERLAQAWNASHTLGGRFAPIAQVAHALSDSSEEMLQVHVTELSLAVLQENTALIKEINELRREIKALKGGLSAAGATAGAPGAKGATRGSAAGRASPDVDLRREMDMQRELIARLREDVSGAGRHLK